MMSFTGSLKEASDCMEVPRGEILSNHDHSQVRPILRCAQLCHCNSTHVRFRCEPGGAALAASSRLDVMPSTHITESKTQAFPPLEASLAVPTADVQTASIRKTACSFAIFVLSWGYGTDSNYATCMS